MPSSFQVLPFILVLMAPSLARSQDPSMVASCRQQLLSLVPCAPFVQGTVPSPPQPCCDNLNAVYGRLPHCLCLVLNATDVVPLPFNNTLALQLPRLCNIPADPSSCGSSPLGANLSRSFADPPAALAAPGPSVTGPRESSGGRAKTEIVIEMDIAVGAATMMMMIMLA